MLRYAPAVSVVMVMLLASIAPSAIIYHGSLTSTPDNLGPIQGQEDWINPGPTSLEWWVTDNDSTWHYKYLLTVPESTTDVSHFTISVSDLFAAENLFNATGNFAKTEIGDFDQDNGNPNIPAPLHGLKFDDAFGTTVTIEFDSDRVAVWGDVYAKGGGNPANEVWNAGIALPDPLDPPADGSIDYHVLVPDSVTPAPAALALLALAGPVVIRRRRR